MWRLKFIGTDNQPMNETKESCQEHREINAVIVQESECFGDVLGEQANNPGLAD